MIFFRDLLYQKNCIKSSLISYSKHRSLLLHYSVLTASIKVRHHVALIFTHLVIIVYQSFPLCSKHCLSYSTLPELTGDHSVFTSSLMEEVRFHCLTPAD